MPLPEKGALSSLGALFGKKGPKKVEIEAEGDESEGEEDSSYGAELAGEELLSAIESKDAKGIYDAIEAIVELCGK
jgi:hypothetical protein